MAYANPDAVTSIGSNSYAYDNAGNQTSAGSNIFTWDWRNLMNTSVVGATSTTYSYDENGKRTRVSDGTTISYYPNDLYQTDSVSGVPTKHIQLNGRDIAVITGATGSSTANYSFPDNQNSMTVVTDSTSNIQQTSDYYPYGSARVSTGSNAQQRKYIGQFSDASGLNYLNARYLSSDRGQFVSEDPVFLGDLKGQDLKNPQNLNAYSYAIDNSMTKSDPTGKFIGIDDAIEIGLIAGFAIEYGPAILGGIGGGFNTYLSHQSNPSTPSSGFAQYATGITAGAASGYLTEASLLRLAAAGSFSAAGSALQDKENKDEINPRSTGLSFVSPGLGYGIFGKLMGPSAI
jgi:RHS repeat-associated protein